MDDWHRVSDPDPPFERRGDYLRTRGATRSSSSRPIRSSRRRVSITCPDLDGIAIVLEGRRRKSISGQVRTILLSELNVAPKTLELWAHVAVCGEIGEDGDFSGGRADLGA